MADDATRVRLEGEDATGPAFDSVRNRLKSLERESSNTANKLAGPASAFDQLGKGIERGLGQGLRSVASSMGPVARSAASAIVPLGAAATVAAAALAALAFAFREGSKENAAFVRELALSNNAVGATASQLASMAREVDAIVGTHREAAAAIAQMAGSGRIARDEMTKFAATAVALERTAGVAASETAKEFAALGKAPLDASLKLNESHRHLTLEIHNQIKALSDHGREAEAAALAQQTYNDALRRVADEMESTLGPWERAWRGIKDVAKEAWDAMLGIGREGQLRSQLDSARERLKVMSPGGSGFGRFAQEEIDRQKKLVEFLEARVATTEGLAAAGAEWTRRQQEGIAAQRENAKWAEAALTRQQRLNTALEEYRRNNEKIRAAGGSLDPAQVAREEAAIRAKFAGKGGRHGDRARVSEVDKYIERLQKQLEKTAELTAYEQALADVEAGRLGKVSAAQLEQVTSLARLSDARREEIAAAEAEAEMQALLGRLRQKEIDENARLIEQMEERANKWLDQLDPMREFIRHVEEVDRVVEALQAKGWAFTPEQIAAFKELGNGLKKAGDEIDDFARRAAKNIQSALGDELFNVLDGKFKSIGDSFSTVLKRIAAEAMAADISRWLIGDYVKTGSLGGFLGGIFKREHGGPVSAGTTYLVGERGPELFTPNTSGAIVPNHKMGGAPMTFAPTLNVYGEMSRSQEARLMVQMRNVALASQADARRRGVAA